MIHIEKFVSELMTGMERLEEYADGESPYTEWDNLQKEPIQEYTPIILLNYYKQLNN